MTAHQRSERGTAYHEAGHSVVATLFGMEVVEVSIIPAEEDGSLGRTTLADSAIEAVVRIRQQNSTVGSLVLEPIAPPKAMGDHDTETIEALRGRVWLECYLMYVLAGEAASLVLTGERDPVGAGRATGDGCSTGDTQAAIGIIGEFFGCGEDPESLSNREATAYWEWLWIRTVGYLNRAHVWKCIDAVAKELVLRRKLSGTEVRALIGAANALPGETAQ